MRVPKLWRRVGKKQMSVPEDGDRCEAPDHHEYENLVILLPDRGAEIVAQSGT